MPHSSGETRSDDASLASPNPRDGIASGVGEAPASALTERARARRRAMSVAVRGVDAVRDLVVPFLATRTMLLLVGLIAADAIPRRIGIVHGPPWLDIWTRWDAGFFHAIARDGYALTSREAFFPLYPLLMRVGGVLFRPFGPENVFLAGFVISNLALAVTVVLLALLVRLDFDRETASRSVLYLLVFPTTLFLSAVYSESLFLALTIGSIYCARTGRWWVAGLLGGAASLTRFQGILIVVPIAYEYMQARGFDIRRLDRKALSLALVPAGLGVFMVYLGWRLGDPLAFAHAQARWGRSLTTPWETLGRFFSVPLDVARPAHSPVDLAFLVLYAVLVVASWRLLRRSYALYATVGFLGLVTTGQLLSTSRLGMVLFPFFIVLAILGRRAWFDRAYLAIASALAGAFMALFAGWYWVA